MIFKCLAEPKTPSIYFDSKKGNLLIEGRCIPEDAKSFFEELMDVIDEYIEENVLEEFKDNPQVLEATINLEYFNTVSSKELLSLFYKLKNCPSKVIWCYEEIDTDMLDSGKDFRDIVKTVPFEFKIIER